MKTVTRTVKVPIKFNVTLEVPLEIIVKDENGEEIGRGTATIQQTNTISTEAEIMYSYEVPSIEDYLLKGVIPSVLIDKLIS